MLLKAAYFRLTGWGLMHPLQVSDIKAAKTYATATLGIPWIGTNLHDLSRWAALLVEERKYRGMAYSASMARTLGATVNRIYLNWREHLRYRANRPYQGEVATVLASVQWLLGQFRFL